MTERAGSRTPQAPRSGAWGSRFCRALNNNRRAHARSLRSAKLGAPRILGPARSGMAHWEIRRHGTCDGQVAPVVGASAGWSEIEKTPPR